MNTAIDILQTGQRLSRNNNLLTMNELKSKLELRIYTMKSKVGILSMQRVVNYGSFLQAYALKKLIEDLGAECFFIDIENGRQLPGNEVEQPFQCTINRIIRIIRNIITDSKKTVLVRRYSQEIRQKFTQEYYALLGLSAPYDGQYDHVVIGSDEVFNCTQKSTFGFSKQLFGQGLNTKNVISYAASFGFTTLERIIRFNLEDELSNYLRTFSALSVRDSNSADIIKKLTGYSPRRHFDPVLIYDFSHILQQHHTFHKNYIIIYTYVNRIQNQQEIKAIRDFAKKYNKKLISIFCAYTWCDEYVVPDTPFDVLAYFRDADFIITDTFHGTIFSTITKSHFCTLLRNTNREKLTSLLSDLRLKDRILQDINDLESILNTEIDYEGYDAVIMRERNNAQNYLSSQLI